jgi:hypothetical protein
MDLSEVIMRIVYLVVLYVIITMLFASFTPLGGNALVATSFFGAVLVLYASFPMVNDFLSNSEIILALKKTDEEKENEKPPKHSEKSLYNETNIRNSKNETNDTNINHKHAYLENVTSA